MLILTSARVTFNPGRTERNKIINKTFVSHIANILNIPIQVPKNTESTAKGVACLAGITAGLMNIDLLEKQEKKVCNPDTNLNKCFETL